LQARESDAGLTLWAPNAYTLAIVRDSYLPQMKRVLDHLAGHSVAVNLQVGAATNGTERNGERRCAAAKARAAHARSESRSALHVREFRRRQIEPARQAAAMQVAQNPGERTTRCCCMAVRVSARRI